MYIHVHTKRMYMYNTIEYSMYSTTHMYIPPNLPLRASFLFPSFSNSLTLHTYNLINPFSAKKFPSSKSPDSRVSSHLTTYYYLMYRVHICTYQNKYCKMGNYCSYSKILSPPPQDPSFFFYSRFSQNGAL